MEIFLTALHVMVCVILVVAVLIQHGKGADIGAVFGGGASNTVFGSRGAGNFLTKLTTGAAILFMVTSLSLSYLANSRANRSLFEGVGSESSQAAPPAGESEATPGGFQEVSPVTPSEAEQGAQASPEPAEPPAETPPN